MSSKPKHPEDFVFEADTVGLDNLGGSVKRNTKRKPVTKPPTFSLITEVWWFKLGESKLRATPFVAMYLLQQGRINGWQPVRVTNAAMRRWNVDRQAKAAALRELEVLGLIKVWRGGSKKSPMVVFLIKG